MIFETLNVFLQKLHVRQNFTFTNLQFQLNLSKENLKNLEIVYCIWEKINRIYLQNGRSLDSGDNVCRDI